MKTVRDVLVTAIRDLNAEAIIALPRSGTGMIMRIGAVHKARMVHGIGIVATAPPLQRRIPPRKLRQPIRFRARWS